MNAVMKTSVRMELDPVGLDKVSWISPVVPTRPMTERFELPMDLTTLEGMSPADYLRKHCIVSEWMRNHCLKIFQALDTDKQLNLSKKKVEEGMRQVHWSIIMDDHIHTVFKWVEFQEDSLADMKLFTAMCCVAGRVLKLHHMVPEKRELIEVADFDSLLFKLKDYHLKGSLHKLLHALQT